MNLFKLFFLNLIYEIRSIDISGKDYKLVKGKKALLNVTMTAKARSVIECATKCDSSNECTHANFRNGKCEFLKAVSPGIETHITEEAGSKYICKLYFNIVLERRGLVLDL